MNEFGRIRQRFQCWIRRGMARGSSGFFCQILELASVYGCVCVCAFAFALDVCVYMYICKHTYTHTPMCSFSRL